MVLECLQVYCPYLYRKIPFYTYFPSVVNVLLRLGNVLTFIGKFYLVDAGYAVRPGFLPPFRGQRYHLREFGNNRPQNYKELYNLRHFSLRTTIERAFAALKNRFRILDNKPFHPYKT